MMGYLVLRLLGDLRVGMLTQGKGPRRLEAAGLKRDGLVAEGTQVDCSLEEAAGEVVWERGRGTEAGESCRLVVQRLAICLYM